MSEIVQFPLRMRTPQTMADDALRDENRWLSNRSSMPTAYTKALADRAADDLRRLRDALIAYDTTPPGGSAA